MSITRKRLPVDVYRRAITVLIGTTADLNHTLARECPDGFEPLKTFAQGHWRCYTHSGFEADYLCFVPGLRGSERAGVVAHECAHLAFHALRTAGVQLAFESEEAFTYYQQWLMEHVFRVMDTAVRR